MNTLVVLVAVIAVAAAATQKESGKAYSFTIGTNQQPSTKIYPAAAPQAYYPGQQAYYPGYQGYNTGYRGYYPAQPVTYPGYQIPAYQGYYPGYTGYQGYQGYQGYNRGYYPVAPPAVYSSPAPAIYSAAPAVTPAPIIAPVPVAPKVSPVYKPVDSKLPAIVRQTQDVNYDGNFNYGYETENGIVAQASGYVKNAGTDQAAQVIEGSYAYVGDDGAPVEVKYFADETGYHAVGNVVPTIPSEIARSLEYNAAHPEKPEASKKK